MHCQVFWNASGSTWAVDGVGSDTKAFIVNAVLATKVYLQACYNCSGWNVQPKLSSGVNISHWQYGELSSVRDKTAMQQAGESILLLHLEVANGEPMQYSCSLLSVLKTCRVQDTGQRTISWSYYKRAVTIRFDHSMFSIIGTGNVAEVLPWPAPLWQNTVSASAFQSCYVALNAIGSSYRDMGRELDMR